VRLDDRGCNAYAGLGQNPIKPANCGFPAVRAVSTALPERREWPGKGARGISDVRLPC
jgi:hypothetical protein